MIQCPGPNGNKKSRAAAAHRKAQARRKLLRNGATLQPSSVITTALILVTTSGCICPSQATKMAHTDYNSLLMNRAPRRCSHA
jgi:hypothetical protein